MRRLMIRLTAVIAVCGFAAWQLSAPKRLPEATLADLTGNPVAGEQVFHAAGCASCHAAPEASGDDKLVLVGGMRFASPFGTFIAPNISSDPIHGIGGWSKTDLANAMLYGTSPTGQHYYPAFPYGSYVRMKLRGDGLQDLANLHAFMQTLPASETPSQPHEVGFPFNIRRGLGLWKRVFLDDYWVASMPLESAPLQRGRYLVEALGHCGDLLACDRFGYNHRLHGGPPCEGWQEAKGITRTNAPVESCLLSPIPSATRSSSVATARRKASSCERQINRDPQPARPRQPSPISCASIRP